MPIISGGGGAGAAGVSASTVIQTRNGSPVGALVPTQVGALCQDLTNGALYQAVGVTNAEWVAVGGNASSVAGASANGSQVNAAGLGVDAASHFVVAPRVNITDPAGQNGTGNSFYWLLPLGGDGHQTLNLQLGSTGQFSHLWAADGTYDLAAAAAAATNAPRLSQVSPKFTITSGALPTVALVSGTGTQILTTRDAETVTPFTGDGTNNAATCAIALSPDNITYSALATISIAAALNLTGVLTDTVNCRVPAGWYIKLTAVHGTIGTTTYY